LNQGWKVAIAGFLINLITGASYSWSIIATNLNQHFLWSYTQATLPYTLLIFIYPIGMIVAGRLQDVFGPQKIVITGVLLLSGSAILSSFMINPVAIAILWGVLWGIGLSCSFASVTPAAIKWFPPSKKGLVTGLVVFGMGISAFFMAPVINYCINQFGLQSTFQIIGIMMLVVALPLTSLIKNPPLDINSSGSNVPKSDMISVREIFSYRQLYLLWVIFCFASGIGATFVSHLDTISQFQYSVERGFIMVSLFSLMNATGRILTGFMFDRLGSSKTMIISFSTLSLGLFLMIFLRDPVILLVAVVTIGLVHGGLFTIFPATVFNFFGERNFGFFYGLIFSGMTVGSFLPLFTGYLFEIDGHFNNVFIVLFSFGFIAATLSFLVKKPRLFH